MKDDPKDREHLSAYWDGPVRRRAEDAGPWWQRLLDLRGVIEG